MTQVTRRFAVALLVLFAFGAGALASLPSARLSAHRVLDTLAGHPVPRPVRTGEPFPSLALLDLDGRSVNLGPGASSGTVVYNVFATWCPPCREEAPALNRAARQFAKRGIKFVGIDRGDPQSSVLQFAQEFGLNYPVVMDADQTTKVLLGARVIPETIVVHDGIVSSISVGPMTDSDFERVVSHTSAT